MNHFFKNSTSKLTLAACVLAILGVQIKASAQMAVVDASANVQLGIANNSLETLNTYLQTGLPGSPGNSLLPLLSAINDKLGKSNANEKENGQNDDTLARQRLYDNNLLDMKAGSTPTQEQWQRACIAISSRMTSPQGDGAAAGASDAYRARRSFAIPNETRLQTSKTALSAVADTVRDRTANGFCDTQDIKNQFPGCTAAGNLPSADIRTSSLTMGATASPSDPTNGSLDAAQQEAAKAYMTNTMPSPPSIPEGMAQSTQRSKIYMATLNRFIARQSAAIVRPGGLSFCCVFALPEQAAWYLRSNMQIHVVVPSKCPCLHG